MDRRHRPDLREGYRNCLGCGEEKLLEEYHRHAGGRLGRRSDCAACRNIINHQKKLEKRLKEGCRSVVECTHCESYMMKSNTRKICMRCKKDGVVEVRKFFDIDGKEVKVGDKVIPFALTRGRAPKDPRIIKALNEVGRTEVAFFEGGGSCHSMDCLRKLDE